MLKDDLFATLEDWCLRPLFYRAQMQKQGSPTTRFNILYILYKSCIYLHKLYNRGFKIEKSAKKAQIKVTLA